jgi:UDP-GlcNAc3NAcA epimerase
MKIVTVVGARPQFIKAAPVSRVLKGVAEEILVHTGQHYDPMMSDIFFSELGIAHPKFHLGVGSGSHGLQTGRMLSAIEEVLISERPDWVMVYGDTNSTLAAAIAAAKLQIPVAHVEAGLRSGRMDMPEEVNRIVTDRVSSLLLCPTTNAALHLANEGITNRVHVIGDVMTDAVYETLAFPPTSSTFEKPVGKYFAATLHRAENTTPDRLPRALAILGSVPGTVAFPLHPRTKQAMADQGLRLPGNVLEIEPLGYADMLSLISNAEAVLTDSGGLQKEAVILGTRVVTLRDETEWVETVNMGANDVVGLDIDLALSALSQGALDMDKVVEIFPRGASALVAQLLVDPV